MKLDTISAEIANQLIAGKHYLGATEYQPTFCFATPERDAVAIYSPPVASHFNKVLVRPLELVRLWQKDGVKRPVSAFLATSMKLVKKLSPDSDCLFSYADPGQLNPHTGEPHTGIVYRATNWEYLGPSRETDYWIDEFNEKLSSPVMYRREKTKSRKILIERGYLLVRKPRKHLYVYGLRLPPDAVRQKVEGRYAQKPENPFKKSLDSAIIAP